MSAFHPGGLAIIKKAARDENLGKTVTLISSTDDLLVRIPGMKVAVNNPLRWKCWIVEGDLTWVDFFGMTHSTACGAIPEEWLMPIEGYTPSKEELREQELITQ